MYLPESSAAAAVTVLKVEPGRVEPLGGAVQQGGRRAGAGGGGVDDARVAVRRLDAVRVVRGRRRHHVDGTRLRVQHHGSSALAAEQRLGQPLRARLQVQLDVVATDGRALQLVGDLVPDRPEVRVRCGQVRVLRALESGARAALCRVADGLRREAVGGVHAEVERRAARLLGDVPCEHRLAVPGVDQAALDLELRHALDRVVLPRGEAGRGPHLPVRRRRDQRGEQQQRDDRDA